ncbi:MAG: glycosyltransferase family 39 protein [Bacteroidia bacterium]|nr:glycosyltransferase family 39 protein [Bacteroidia bacterium]
MYHSTISLFPAFVHSWTQSERYALSLGFLNNGFDLFHPCTYNLQTIEGITRVDLPINEYIVAIIMKISGSTNPAIFRIYTLTISITGCLFLYLLSLKVNRSEIKSWTIVLIAFLSPIYTYYQAGFLPSIPAISFIFIGYYYYYLFLETGKRKQFYIALFFILLAALIRIPFVIYLVALLAHMIWTFLKSRKIVFHELLFISICFIIFFSYYRYNVHLGRMYGNMFLDELLPARNMEEFNDILKQIKNVLLFQYQNVAFYLLLSIGFVFTSIQFIRKKEITSLHNHFLFHCLIVSSGAVLYFLAMMRQFFDHDYYFLDSLFVPSIFLLIGISSFIPLETLRSKIIWSVLSIIALFFSFISNQTNQQERYKTYEWDRVEISRQNFIGSESYLDSLGIDKEAKILVIDAYSTNIPLILMNRKGYTVYQTNRDDAFLPLIKYKWDYVVIQDQFLISDVLHYYPIVQQMIERLDGNGKISIYKKSKDYKLKSLEEFLNIQKKNALYCNKFSFDETTQPDGIITEQIAQTNDVFRTTPSAAFLNKDMEYGNIANIKGTNFENKQIKAFLQFYLKHHEALRSIQLVSAVTHNDSMINYQSVDLGKFSKTNDQWNKVELLFVPPPLKEGDKWALYIWNKEREMIYYDDLEITIYE